MQWLRSHPYVAALIGTVVLILLGAFVVKERIAVRPEYSETRAWGGVGAQLLNPISRAPNYTGSIQEDIYREVRSGPPFYYSPAPAQIPFIDAGGSGDFDFDAFLALLSQPAGGKPGEATSDNSLLDTAYSFIPGGLISTSTTHKVRTPIQQALYNYGNEAGSSIQSFESTFGNASQILKDQFEDRESPSKNAALRALAEGLTGVGKALEGMGDVPSEVERAHAKVAASYRELGDKLSRVPGAKSEQEILDGILAYNSAAESYVKNYVALATLLSAYGVMFAPDDPGSVFTFTNVGL